MRKHPLFWLPNLLTMLRLTMSVLIAWMIIKVAQFEMIHVSGFDHFSTEFAEEYAALQFRQFWGRLAFLTFVVSAVTDWLDGYLARKFEAESQFGRLLDPIADKFTVNLPLLAIAWAAGWALPIMIPVMVIIVRDALITGLRFAGLGASSMAVSAIAKVKTMLEMVLVAVFLAIMAMLSPFSVWTDGILTTWLFGLWGVAVLSGWTGLVYILRLTKSEMAK